ncbi:MAG: oligosaccharide flippase family protein, partial [Clostridia bacterium]|nr:oligosaccharide flippase family protein [Clostridia bacterium]
MKNTFVKSALLLSVTALLVKIIGAAYRIPLSSMLGAGQMGVYTTAFHIYALVSSLSTAGIPIASAQL